MAIAPQPPFATPPLTRLLPGLSYNLILQYFLFYFYLFYDYIKFFFSRRIISLTWMIFPWLVSLFVFLMEKLTASQFLYCFGHNLWWWKNMTAHQFWYWCTVNVELAISLKDIDGYMGTYIVLVWDIDIDGERDWHSIIEIATRRFYKYPIALVVVPWRQFRLINFISHLRISETLILKKGVTHDTP